MYYHCPKLSTSLASGAYFSGIFSHIKTSNDVSSTENIRAVMKQTAQDLEWHLEINNDKMVIARTHPKWWTGSWGEQITIIIDNPRIMINSICDPNKKTSVVSMGRNKKNINNLIENIKSANK